MGDFADQEAALATARAVLQVLFDTAVHQIDPDANPALRRTLTRRELLRGAFLGE